MELYNAIFLRKSTRKYSGRKLPEELLQGVKAAVENAERLYASIDMKIHVVEAGEKVQEVLPGIVGSYGKVRAPHYLVITSEEKEGFLQNIGYTVEKVVLKLTTMGIATCWLGGGSKKELWGSVADIPDNHVPVLLVAFGFAAENESPYRDKTSKIKRKDISQITAGAMDLTWSKIVSAVRVAPSAVNSQPWRIIFQDGRVYVFCDGNSNAIFKHFFGSLNMVDIGIALCHLEVAALNFSKTVRFSKDLSAEYKAYEYVTTVMEI
ncbi:MAG: nitroreductase family protein [Caulobacteraceae bacterium]